ncbi:hypothetical protein J31TS4_29510 [Paenibacillus sp. J31TS4]|uniref:hypothetical protein n=1 Tax=Paenibacillus sp. J31TS4 TaxID=2807195 RepID=UPI001B1FFB6F|nr:hypothetical protein [Paenibacillus sp. J31TS4]GIP39671.1 hypothetical protein J31TS4_29510 [Paenibacillus sp. J31TS4]
MAYYTQGTSALQQKQVVRKEPVKLPQPGSGRGRHNPVREKLFYLVMVLLPIAIWGVAIWQSASVYDLNTRISKSERAIRDANIEASSLKQQMDKMKDYAVLEAEAKKNGLRTPSESQIVKLTDKNGSAPASSSKVAAKTTKP